MTSIPLNDTIALNNDIVKQWIPGPRTRGTIDILWTCLVTIILCVWSAIHMNVPGHHETQAKRIRRRTRWVICGLLLPEFVLWTAWRQFSSARALVKALNHERYHQMKNRTLTAPILEPFNLRYGFFAVMGGIRVTLPVELDHNDESGLLNFTLTPDGLKLLAERGNFVQLDDAEIQDRSKADTFAKLLVCTQITWLLVDCIRRKSSGLPITLLEIHTFTHVICSLCIYGLWFKKPFDVTEATAARSLEITDEFTLARVITKILNMLNLSKSKYQPLEKFLKGVDSNKIEQVELSSLNKNRSGNSWWWEEFTAIETTILVKSSKGGVYQISIIDSLSLQKSTRQRVAPAIDRIGSTIFGDRFIDLDAELKYRAPDFPNVRDFLSVFLKEIKFTAMGILIEMVYGGVHVAAWNSHFPTVAEMWLWRSSSLLIGGATPIVLTIMFLLCNWADGFENRRSLVEAILLSLDYFLFVPVISLHFPARLFLIVESIISLRSVPIGVFATVQWANYIPHI